MIEPKTAEHYTWGGACDGWHLVQGADLSVIQERMPPGASEIRHRHEKARQFFFVLQGVVILEIDGTASSLHRGQGAEVPPGSPHQMQNRSDEAVEFLVISAPTTRGDRQNVDGATSR